MQILQILRVRAPWWVAEVELDTQAEEVRVLVGPDSALCFGLADLRDGMPGV
jgi:hypothetical protein